MDLTLKTKGERLNYRIGVIIVNDVRGISG